jgi:hypothetical protein
MERQSIVVDNRADREALAVILVRAGYSVRQIRSKSAGGRTTYTIEYWRD